MSWTHLNRNLVVGGYCNSGRHLLTEDNIYTRPSSGERNCRLCRQITSHNYITNNKAKIQARQLEWSRNNKERKWRTGQKHRLMKLYGLTLEALDALWSEQAGTCAICGEKPEHSPVKSRRPHWLSLYIDHDHSTGKVRGLLCWHCNCALGHFRDNEKTLLAAISYLQQPR